MHPLYKHEIEELWKKYKGKEGELALYLMAKLTPGGSEFHNDPIRCYQHVAGRLVELEAFKRQTILARNREMDRLDSGH